MINEIQNGKLSNLTPIQGGAGHKLNPEAAAAYDKMVAAAKEDGVTWSITDSYRPYEVQNKIFDWNFFKKTGKKRKLGTGGTPVAYPGTSNHGWGAAVDLGAKYGDKAHTWLTKNASKFGFSNPFSNPRTEPWHWEHVASAKKMKSGAELIDPEKENINGDDTSISGGTTNGEKETIDKSLETNMGGDKKSKSVFNSPLFGSTSSDEEDTSNYGLINQIIDMATHKENINPKNDPLLEEIKRIKQLLK